MSLGCSSTNGSLINFRCKCSSFLNSVQIDWIYLIPLITETSPWRSHTNKYSLNKSLASIMITISEKANANSSKTLDIVPAGGDSLMKSVIFSHWKVPRCSIITMGAHTSWPFCRQASVQSQHPFKETHALSEVMNKHVCQCLHGSYNIQSLGFSRLATLKPDTHTRHHCSILTLSV